MCSPVRGKSTRLCHCRSKLSVFSLHLSLFLYLLVQLFLLSLHNISIYYGKDKDFLHLVAQLHLASICHDAYRGIRIVVYH